METLPDDIQARIDVICSASPLRTIVPCRKLMFSSDEFRFQPFTSDTPLVRSEGRFLSKDRVALQCDIDQIERLRPDLEGSDRRVFRQVGPREWECTNHAELDWGIVRDEGNIYMLTDLTTYTYQHIGTIEPMRHHAHSSLRCTSKHFAGLPRSEWQTTNCVFRKTQRVEHIHGYKAQDDRIDINFYAVHAVNQCARDHARWFTDRYDFVKVSVVELGPQWVTVQFVEPSDEQ